MAKRRRNQEYIQWLFKRHKVLNQLAVAGCNDFVLVLDHLSSDFNIGKIFRSAEAFGAQSVHLVGIESFDPTPAMGAFKAVPAFFHDDFYRCHRMLKEQDRVLFTLEPEVEVPLTETELPVKAAFILGHEEYGISFDKADFPDVSKAAIIPSQLVDS